MQIDFADLVRWGKLGFIFDDMRDALNVDAFGLTPQEALRRQVFDHPELEAPVTEGASG